MNDPKGGSMGSKTGSINSFKRQNPHVMKYRNKKILLNSLKYLLVWAVVVSISLTAGERTYLIPIVITAGEIITLLFLNKDRKLITGRWSGAIKSIKVDTERVKTKGEVVAKGMYTSMHDRNFIVCKVLTDKGKNKKFMLPEEYGKVFREGDAVLSIPGIAYKIDLTNKDMTLCPKCGSIYPSANERCVTIGCHMPKINI